MGLNSATRTLASMASFIPFLIFARFCLGGGWKEMNWVLLGKKCNFAR